MTKYPKWNRVNVVAWAKETMNNESCQTLSDTKPFTGKGTAQILRQLVSEIDTVEAEMADLAGTAKSVPGATIYLAQHRRSLDGYMALRWRALRTRKHVSWQDAEAYFLNMPSSTRSWYEQANALAQELNAKHLELRKVARGLKDYVQRREPKIFARPIPERA